MTGILILIGSLGSLKEAKTMGMILGKCKFLKSFPFFSNICCRYILEHMSFSINEFFTISFFKQIRNHFHCFSEMSM